MKEPTRRYDVSTIAGRTDIHAPSQFDPADYRVIDYIDNRRPELPRGWAGVTQEALNYHALAVQVWQARIFKHFPDWRTGGEDHRSISQCNHCGHPGIRWVAVVEYIPTGAKLAFGEQCADRVELEGRDAFRSKFIKDRAAREVVALERQAAEAEFNAANAGLREFLFQNEDDDFLGSLYRQLLSKGTLSERQIETARRSQERGAERQARIEAEQAALADVEPLREGRREITGEVASLKWQDSDFGGNLKMLVREDDGNKVWGTVPGSLISARYDEATGDYTNTQETLVGSRVSFKAAVERSRDDEHFGFFKRPTGATRIEAVAV
jgi:hypothetical protein